MAQTDDERYEPGCGSGARCSATTTSTEPSRDDAFTEPFQEFITRTAWGDVWDRPASIAARAR